MKRLAVILLVTIIALSALVACSSPNSVSSSASSTTESDRSPSSEASVQGSANSSALPENPAPELSFYDGTIERYRQMLCEGASDDGGNGPKASMLDMLRQIEGGEPVYAFVDLAGDGFPELVIAVKYSMAGNSDGTSGSTATYRVFDLYGIRDDEAVRLVTGGPDGMQKENLIAAPAFGLSYICYLDQSNWICSSLSPDITISANGYWRLPPDSITLELQERIDGGSRKYWKLGEGATTVDPAQMADIYAQNEPNESIDWVGL